MKLGVLKETNDQRVALVPSQLKKIADLGLDILVESGAGAASGFSDEAYSVGATTTSRKSLLADADIILSIDPMPDKEIQGLSEEKTLVALFEPYNDDKIAEQLNLANVRAFSLDMIPRTSLAQSMDILSSMASIAGYKAVLKAADHLPRYFPMMITAAGSIKPTTVLVLGAGVAGLQAIATAKRLGAMVEAFDVRAAAKEEVKSLGAKFIEVEGAVDDTAAGGYAVQQSEDYIKRQQAEVQNRATKADVIITTAQVRGRKAPVLVSAETVEQMKPGSVIVDLAASTGGNCALTKNDATIQHKGVTIIGDSNLAQTMPEDASTLFGNNVINFLKLLVKDGELTIDMDNVIIAKSLVTKP